MSVTEQTTVRGQSLEGRRQRLGASEAAIALGASPYGSAFELWCQKTGAISPDDLSDVEHVQWGVNLERPILEEYGRRTGRTIAYYWPQDKWVTHSEIPWLSCTPDAFQDREGSRGIAQVKNTGEYSRSLWHDGPPLHVQIQVQTEMEVCGFDWGTIVVLIGGNKLRYFDVERNQSFINAMLPVLKEFWDRVENGDPPLADGSFATSRALAKLYPGDNGSEVELPAEAAEWDSELLLLKQEIKSLEQLKGLLENRLKAAIGDATLALIPGGGAYSFKQQTRKAYEVKESTYRVLRRLISK